MLDTLSSVHLRTIPPSCHKHLFYICTARHHSGYWSKRKCSGRSLPTVADPPSIWQTVGPAAAVPDTPWSPFSIGWHPGAYLYLIMCTLPYYVALFPKNNSSMLSRASGFLKKKKKIGAVTQLESALFRCVVFRVSAQLKVSPCATWPGNKPLQLAAVQPWWNLYNLMSFFSLGSGLVKQWVRGWIPSIPCLSLSSSWARVCMFPEDNQSC